jgi:hypothetical protein
MKTRLELWALITQELEENFNPNRHKKKETEEKREDVRLAEIEV